MSALVDQVRDGIGGALRSLLSGDPEPRPIEIEPGDGGLFGPGSATWVVHGDLSMLVGGLRALLLQTLHPLAMAGVAEHSDYRADPWGRLHRTGAFVGATTYGTTERAEQAIETVRRVHERVRGTAPDGRPYSATDPDLIRWVHVTEVDSFLRAHRRFGAASLSPRDEDRYVDEMAEIGRRLGGSDIPTSVAGLRRSLSAFRPDLAATHQTRDAVRFLLVPPVSATMRVPYGVISSAAIGLLPGFVRRMLWLPVPPLAEPVVVRPAATAVLRVLGWALGESPERRAAVQRVDGAATP